MPKADPWTKLFDLQSQSSSPAKISAIEAFVREADSSGDKDLAVAAREALIEAGVFGGAHDKALVAFAWCLAQYDKNSEEIDGDDLLWRYKWILGSLPEFPTISQERIKSLQNDFEQRLKTHGFSMRPILNLRMGIALEMGEIDEAQEWYQQWKAAKRDAMANCRACEMNAEVASLSAFGQYSQAVKKAVALINGKHRCEAVPQSTYGKALYPLIQLGRLDQAKVFQKTGYPLVAKKHNLLTTIAQHLFAAAAFDDLSHGIRIIEKHLPWAIATNELLSRMRFFHSTALLLERVAQTRPKPRKLKLPATLSCYRADSTYSPEVLANHFRTEADLLAAAFDRRNGNRYFATLFDSDRASSPRIAARGAAIE
ncbi:MAG: hypothetical protein ACKV2Q_08120 [Planctomycetaceae bacterium]